MNVMEDNSGKHTEYKILNDEWVCNGGGSVNNE